jgi:hypothetical protein
LGASAPRGEAALPSAAAWLPPFAAGLCPLPFLTAFLAALAGFDATGVIWRWLLLDDLGVTERLELGMGGRKKRRTEYSPRMKVVGQVVFRSLVTPSPCLTFERAVEFIQ